LTDRSINNMSPRTPQQYEVIRDEKRNLIMDVALQLFAVNGYHNTTISQISKQAGISKGLMYNYFKSKEELLSEILGRSEAEILSCFDPNRDGYLSEDEFVHFVQMVFQIIREKISFWRLFYQFLLQKDVRESFIMTHIADSVTITDKNSSAFFIKRMLSVLRDFFIRKKERMPSGYDPETDMKMFLYTIEGYGLSIIFNDTNDDEKHSRTIDAIINYYK